MHDYLSDVSRFGDKPNCFVCCLVWLYVQLLLLYDRWFEWVCVSGLWTLDVPLCYDV